MSLVCVSDTPQVRLVWLGAGGACSHGVMLQSKTSLSKVFQMDFAVAQPSHHLGTFFPSYCKVILVFILFTIINARSRFCRKNLKYRKMFKRKN